MEEWSARKIKGAPARRRRRAGRKEKEGNGVKGRREGQEREGKGKEERNGRQVNGGREGNTTREGERREMNTYINKKVK